MKKILLIFIILIFVVFSAAAAEGDIIDSAGFAPVTPEVIGQGGSFTAIAHGYNALFTNPAGFAMDGGSFTLLSATGTSFFIPSEGDIENFETIANAESDTEIEDALLAMSPLITGNGIGGAGTAGIGLVGNGLGLGFVANADFYGRGETALGTAIDAVMDYAIIGGYALPIELGPLTAYVGGDLRYMLRTEARDVAIVEFASAASSTTEDPQFPVLSGSGLAFDLGTIIELGKWSVGVAARDIGGTTLEYTEFTADSLDQAFQFDGGGAEVAETYVIPMVMSVGAAYDPDSFLLPSFIFDPVFHMEYRKTFYQAEDAKEDSFWTGVHLGMEAEVIRLLKVRAGINQGYATFGLGAKLLFLDLNASYFVREMGRYAGVQPNEGFTLEAAIRF
jgi:hypothetical protein